MGTTPMFSPDGQMGDIPNSRVPDAVRSGFKKGVNMKSGSGDLGIVPEDRVPEAFKSGFSLFMPSEEQAAAHAPVAPLPKSVTNLSGAMSHKGFREKYIDPAEAFAANQLPTIGTIAGGALGSFEPGGGNIAGAALGGAMGVQARRLAQGQPTTNREALIDTGTGAMSGAGAEMGGQIIGKGLEAGIPALKGAFSPSSPKAAAGLFERGVAPGGMSAEDQAVMRDYFQRAQKYIAPETRGYPVKGGEGGAMRTAQIAHRAADNLWQGSVQPVVDIFKDVQRHGDDVAQAIRSSFTDLDRTTKPAAVEAGNKLASMFEGRPISVGEMADTVKQLNNDRGVSRFYNMSPNEQVQAEMADPSLRAKVTALDTLRGKMFDTIGETGGTQLGDQFAEARKDWGALRSVEDQIRGTRVPTPQPISSRIANTLRGSLSPKGPDMWMRGSETLFNLNNPNRLLPHSFNALGRTDLNPPMMDVRAGAFTPRALLGSGSIIPPAPADASGPVDLGSPPVQPLADNRQLPGLGRTTGRANADVGPSQFGIAAPAFNPRPLTGPERQLPQFASPAGRGLPAEATVPLSQQKVWQKPPSFELPRSTEENPASAYSIDRDAKQEVDALHHLWSELPAPGRFQADHGDNSGNLMEAPRNREFYGINSPKPAVEKQFPWLHDLPMMTLSRVKAAVQKGSGIDYNRIMKAASDYLAKQRGL